ncbi:MAG TPA: phosphoribosylformylglycinamidine cyclo-ligase [Abditibacteriaceae bacterium]
MKQSSSEHATYASAGVNIEAGNEVVRRIKPHVQRTRIPGVLGGIGGFGGLFQPNLAGMQEPVLVSGTDSVGTKLKVAFALGKHDTIGQDVVAMNVNDVLCCGARPLFFLDYLGVGQLEVDVAEAVIKGVADGCADAGCALIGGETAELPGIYTQGEYDLVGCCVGIVDKAKIIDGSTIKAGDVIIGLPSSGLHSNGYSLARKILEPLGFQTQIEALGTTLGEAMLAPTKIYVRPVLSVLEHVQVKGIVHITGGGFYENIPRVLPAGTRAAIEHGSWPVPPLFALLQEQGNVLEREMFTTFNMGIGLILVIEPAQEEAARRVLGEYSMEAFRIGTIEACDDAPHVTLRS